MTEKIKLVYTCGPFTAATHWLIKQNVDAAEKYSLEIAKLGAMPVCPHKMTDNFHGLLTPEFWYEATLQLMRRCDAVLLLPGWDRSKGAMEEWEEAKRLKLPMFSTVSQLHEWLKINE